MLAKVKRRNLTVLKGCFINQDVRLLLYDYMPNNSLASLTSRSFKTDQPCSRPANAASDRPGNCTRNVIPSYTVQPTYSTWRCKTKQCAFWCGLWTTSLWFRTHGLDQNTCRPNTIIEFGRVTRVCVTWSKWIRRAHTRSWCVQFWNGVTWTSDRTEARRFQSAGWKHSEAGEADVAITGDNRGFQSCLARSGPRVIRVGGVPIGCENCSLVYRSRPCRPTLRRRGCFNARRMPHRPKYSFFK